MAVNNPYLDMLRRGIGTVESSNNYGARGPLIKYKDGTTDYAYGKYQVTGRNIPNWTQAALGRSMTPQEFLADTDAQEKVFNHRMGGYLDQYNNPEDATSLWFSGKPMKTAGNASDGYNTVPEYIQKVLKAGGQDPRSFMAKASPELDQAPLQQGAQSINLGNEEQQPFNNIGSTLANMGASIASLDNRGTGIASLNASRVASNLQQQEALRERENGWKYAGQTDNGQGLIFQNSKGETRIEPIAPQFSGQKEPETIRTLKMLQADPSLLETKKEMSGDNGQDTVLTDEGVESAVEAKFAGRKDAYTGMTKKGRELAMNKEAEFKKKYGVTDEDIMSNQGKWAGVFGAEREYSKRIAMVGTAERSLSAAIEQGRGLLQDPEVKSMLNQPRLINQFNQMTAEQLNTEGLGKLAKLKENFETVAQDYTRVNAMGGSTTTVRAQDIARGILNTGMSDKAINELFDYMGQTGLRVKDALNAGQEELRTNARKHTRIEDYQKSQAASEKAIADRLDKDMVRFGLKPKETIRGSSSKGLPGVGQKTTINGVEIERLD